MQQLSSLGGKNTTNLSLGKGKVCGKLQSLDVVKAKLK
jgi:hypothetical protein